MPIKRKSQSSMDPNLRILVEVTGVILVWRGVWSLADRYLFPSNPDLSAIVSIVFGILILYMENKNLKDLM